MVVDTERSRRGLSSLEMEDSYETPSNGKSRNSGLQIIRHPSYQSYNKFSSPWLDIRVFYVRISNFLVNDFTPEYLTVNHIPLSPDTLLEVNGVRCNMYSEGMPCLLRRDRVDKKSEEATFVSTDSVRLTGGVEFEVFDGEILVLSGILEMSYKNGFTCESKSNERIWKMDCESLMSPGTGFLKGRQTVGFESQSPTIDVYVAGCFSGTPIILTKTLQLTYRKKNNRKGGLDSIPEYDEIAESQKEVPSGHDLKNYIADVLDVRGACSKIAGVPHNNPTLPPHASCLETCFLRPFLFGIAEGILSSLHVMGIAEYKYYKMGNEDDYNNLYWRRRELEGEEGELSWFNAGVRVGVGLGLGICLGVGVGVGLLVRTYKTTSRTLRRLS